MKSAWPRAAMLLTMIAANLAPHPALAQRNPADAPPPPVTDAQVDAAISKALAFLLANQNADGSFWPPPQTKRATNATALTSLSIMALISAGHAPADRSREGEALRKGLDFILRPDRVRADGYFGEADGSRMYGHGITTLMLTEVLGMGADANQDRLIRERCEKAIALILASQRTPKEDDTHVGGWRYLPTATDADLSVTIWQIVALRSARNDGLDVPKEAIDSAMAYVRRLYKADKHGAGFLYMPRVGPRPAMTGAGLLAMQICDLADAPEAVSVARRLAEAGPPARDRWHLYSLYYYAQSMHQVGGETAERSHEQVAARLLSLQQPDGGWQPGRGDERRAGPVYGTAMAVLSLTVKHHYLPIYQR